MTFFELTSKNGTMNFRLSWWFVLVIVVVLGIGIFRARNGRHWEPVDATIHLGGTLNDGLRPHLTKWQARFRRWCSKAESDDQFAGMSPQDIQKNFPNYKELTADLKQMNDYLKEYTNAIRMIAHGHNVIIVKEGPHA